MTFEDLDDLLFRTLVKYENHADNSDFGKAEDWIFEIEKTKSVGYCSFRDKKIVLNEWVFENSSEEQILDTLYHEAAHALAGLEMTNTGRVMGHGKLWKSWARRLGATPKATVPLSELGEGATNQFKKKKRTSKYYIVLIDESYTEIVGNASRKLVGMASRYLKGRKNETLGKLYLVPTEKYCDDPAVVAKNALR